MTAPGSLSAVALGGGHGLYATVTALRQVCDHVTAVVTVADDGGSSGRLRSELAVIPPGDLRMAVAALLEADASGPDDPAARWAAVLQHRFRGRGALAGHPIGNLLLAGLQEHLGDPVAALDAMAELFGITGRVLPMSTVPLGIEADVSGLEDDPRISRSIAGQVAVATTPGKVRRVRLLPTDPPACQAALEAIASADLVTLGPGSWFSSVIPHVLVPAQLAALRATSARRVLFVNLAPEPGETSGFSVERHLHVLHAHADDLRIDDVVIDGGSVPSHRERDHVRRAADRFGATLHVADLARPGTQTHDPARVAAMVHTLTGARRDGYSDGADRSGGGAAGETGPTTG